MLIPDKGLEPLTSALKGPRSTSWAKPVGISSKGAIFECVNMRNRTPFYKVMLVVLLVNYINWFLLKEAIAIIYLTKLSIVYNAGFEPATSRV